MDVQIPDVERCRVLQWVFWGFWRALTLFIAVAVVFALFVLGGFWLAGLGEDGLEGAGWVMGGRTLPR